MTQTSPSPATGQAASPPRWPEERPDDATLAAAVHGEVCCWNAPDIDAEFGEEEAEHRHVDLEPIGPRRFRVTSAESHGSIVDVLTHPAPGSEPRGLLRMWGRLAARQERSNA